ncbi:MAG: nitroreductase family protein [Methanocalculus sp. MSAO_Arc1]|uniref:nitroreductase family protein n=1 Tax=Methanocalculus TaxID=71151 RepID=UPI000FF6D495|nr:MULTISPECIES: nitroreductase family protein [unclassified Methanocalculus]MCP1663065.1 nitroreductase [Methanocalculus sp. AMF5]RQD81741.1 MAG: nitroreductase family protein [Methanocalculus sp. MSAO_Arc1]
MIQNKNIANFGVTIIQARHSIRHFKDSPIPEEIIRKVLDCAKSAPSARNIQPWLFGIITDARTRSQIADLTDHGKFIAEAPVCFAVFGERDQQYVVEDCCAATENILIALTGYGIGSCWVAGHGKAYAEPIREMLGVPEKYTLISLIAAGEAKTEGFVLAKKKSLDEITFKERFGSE